MMRRQLSGQLTDFAAMPALLYRQPRRHPHLAHRFHEPRQRSNGEIVMPTLKLRWPDDPLQPLHTATNLQGGTPKFQLGRGA
jgi:hypothetical protein